jgi:hypothetical protein
LLEKDLLQAWCPASEVAEGDSWKVKQAVSRFLALSTTSRPNFYISRMHYIDPSIVTHQLSTLYVDVFQGLLPFPFGFQLGMLLIQLQSRSSIFYRIVRSGRLYILIQDDPG